MDGWYKIWDGTLYKLNTNNNIIDLYGKFATELFIPNGITNIYCNNNNLTELIVPDQVEYIDCRFNGITELIVPDHCHIDCDPRVLVITKSELRSNRLKAILK